MIDSKEKREIERSEALDKTIKIFSSLIPGGSSVYELFTVFIQPLHEQRREEWIREVTLRLHKLEEEKKIDMKLLAEDQEFNTIITKASLLAQQNHQIEKIEALKNIVSQSAEVIQNGEFNYSEATYFIRVIEQVEAPHILLLKTFLNPVKTAKELQKEDLLSDTARLITFYFRLYDNRNDELLMAQFWKELYNLGLVNKQMFDDQFIINEDTGESDVITDLGKNFIEMIKESE